MKIFLASIVSIIFTTSAFGCEICDFANEKFKEVNESIKEFQKENNCSFESKEFHYGYLFGQQQAYYRIITLSNDFYPD